MFTERSFLDDGTFSGFRYSLAKASLYLSFLLKERNQDCPDAFSSKWQRCCMWLVNAMVYSTLLALVLFAGAAFVHLAGQSNSPVQQASIILIAPQTGAEAATGSGG